MFLPPNNPIDHQGRFHTWETHLKPTSPLILNSRGCCISKDAISQRIVLQVATEQSWKEVGEYLRIRSEYEC